MIFKVAWRNIWRSKVRSFIVIGSIAVGIWAGLLIIGFSFGMNNERTASAIGTTIGHAQIHSAAFDVEPLSGAELGTMLQWKSCERKWSDCLLWRELRSERYCKA